MHGLEQQSGYCIFKLETVVKLHVHFQYDQKLSVFKEYLDFFLSSFLFRFLFVFTDY